MNNAGYNEVVMINEQEKNGNFRFRIKTPRFAARVASILNYYQAVILIKPLNNDFDLIKLFGQNIFF